MIMNKLNLISGADGRPRINFQLVGGPTMYVEEVDTWEKPQIRVVDDRSRFRRSKQREG